MAETVSIILEYLRRHHFTRAEAALRSELQARQGSTGSLFLLPRDDLDLGLSSLDPVKEEASPYSKKDLHGDQSFHGHTSDPGCLDSKAQHFLPDMLMALGLQAKDWQPQSERPSPGAVLKTGYGASVIQKKPASEQGEHEVVSHNLVDNMSLPSGTPNSVETMLNPEQDSRAKMQDIELGILPDQVGLPRSKVDKQGVGLRSWKLQMDDGNIGGLERIIGVQNEKEDFKSWQKNDTFCKSIFQQEFPEIQGGNTNCAVENAGESGLEHPSNESFGQTFGRATFGMRRWEELYSLSLHEVGCDFFQPDIGAPQLEKSTIVHESGEFSGKSLLHGRAYVPRSLPLSEVPENQCESIATGSYGALMENGWLDHERLRDGLPRSLGKGVSSNSSHSYFLCCPSDEKSLVQIQQHEEKQVDCGECVQALTAQGKERETRPVDFLKELTLPWEVDFSNETARLGGFEDAKATTDETHKEFPRLPHVRVRSIDKNLDLLKENSGTFNLARTSDQGHRGSTDAVSEPSFDLGSYLDIPVGQDIASSGVKRPSGGSRPSVSQGIVEDTPELLSGFATLGDEPNDSGVGYPHEYWDSDAYEDDDDPGYHRQPIEDEAWFLAHEIDYPSDDDKAKSSMAGMGSHSHSKKGHENQEDDGCSQIEEESYFSGEQFYKVDQGESISSLRAEGVSMTNFFGSSGENDPVRLSQIGNINYDGHLMDAEELKLMRAEPVWRGFDSQNNQLGLLGGEKIMPDLGKSQEEESSEVDDDKQGSVRSSGIGISSDVADLGSEARDSLVAGSSEGEREGYEAAQMRLGRDCTVLSPGQDVARHSGDVASESDAALRCFSSDWGCKSLCTERQKPASSSLGLVKSNDGHPHNHIQDDGDGCGFGFGGFSFPSPSSTGDLAGPKADSGKSLWVKENVILTEDIDVYGVGIAGPDETLASWKRKSNESSPILSPRDEALLNVASSVHSTVSPHSTDGYLSREAREEKEEDEIGTYDKEDVEATVADNEETAALQEQFRQMKAEEDEYEIFNLRIVHRKNRTGFEEEKNFPVVINSVIAGRYHVTEYLGSAAFSKAIQARDLQTGLDVCMKIIKNNKDFFDQSLDEIKLLKFINKHDPADKYHILRLYDYFYYREHLFIVCELLRANLYEFHKFNRESGGEVYFTMPRLQSITRQCLEALEFLHNLGLIHCDLKPENILVKSYSRCEVKVIDLGSSCFQTDHLCAYVQSRSYRAPEVILGLPYNQKIDIWSLGCILAELCSGNVLFQNDSLATLLTRVVGIIGPIDPEMLSKGRDTHKYFTKNYMLYERNQDTNQLEYLLPKKTSLRHRLPMGDQGFVDFVGYLLQVNPENRPSASEALKHPWLSYPYEPISS